MKKLLLTITLIFCGMTSFAQRDYSVIKGNVAEKNVNIIIINTSFGVSSDDKGDFIMMLPKMENKVGLLFSCIGYEDTLVSVIPNRDTININFKMKETAYMLDAVGVGADKIRHYSEPSYVICDFEIYDDKVFILQRKWNTLKECRILVQDLWLDPIDTINIPQHIESEKIITDCTESCQLIGKDSVYQIVRTDDSYKLMFPTEKERYNKVLNNIIFLTDKYIYFNELLMDGYISNFFRIKKESKEKEMLFVCNDMKTRTEISKLRGNGILIILVVLVLMIGNALFSLHGIIQKTIILIYSTKPYIILTISMAKYFVMTRVCIRLENVRLPIQPKKTSGVIRYIKTKPLENSIPYSVRF